MDIVEQLLKVALLGSAWVLYLLLALSMFSISVMLERGVFFVRNGRGSEGLRERVLDAVAADDEVRIDEVLGSSQSVEGRVVSAAFRFRDGGGDAITNALESELATERLELEKGLNFLGTVGNNTPFIGLLGTVIGVIDAFRALGSDAAQSGAMGDVMSGIAEALVATGVGLFVALPAVVAYNILQKKIGDIEQETIGLGRLVTAWAEIRGRGGRLRGEATVVTDAREATEALAEGRS